MRVYAIQDDAILGLVLAPEDDADHAVIAQLCKFRHDDFMVCERFALEVAKFDVDGRVLLMVRARG